MSNLELNDLLVHNTSSLKTFAFSLTRDDDDAKDLLQETIYRALANIEKYHVGTNIKAWMYTIMRNIFINDYRRKARNKTVMEYGSNDFLLNQGRFITDNTAETQLKHKEALEAIHKLPEIFKHPFTLYFEGYKYNEIAELLQEPLGTIKSRIHFARKLLKEQLSRYE